VPHPVRARPSVRRHLLRSLILSVVVSCATASDGGAQSAREKGVGCYQHGYVGDCDGTADCNRVWAEHVRRYHRGDGGMETVVAASFSPLGTPSNVALRSILLAGFIGATVGSFADTTEGDFRMTTAGALAGPGLMLSTGVIANRKAWGLPASTVLGGLAGGALGGGIGKAMEKSPEGSAQRKLEQERTATMALTGATVGATTGFGLNLLSRIERLPGTRYLREGSRVHVRSGTDGVSVSIRW
jgi:hypothetical protein